MTLVEQFSGILIFEFVVNHYSWSKSESVFKAFE